MIRLGLVLAVLWLACPYPAIAWEGKVVFVKDGDLITALHDGREETIRLFGVDTPDEPQDFGKQARDFTSERVLGKTIEVSPVTLDRHGNTVAMVWVKRVSLNGELARSGLAWVYGRDCIRPECKEWKEAEIEARARGIGLWSAVNPTSPWDFRRSGGNAAPIGSSQMTEGDWQKRARAFKGDIVKHIYHASGCPEYNCKSCIAEFNSEKGARSAGYKPCPACNP